MSKNNVDDDDHKGRPHVI